ncbi:22849_t:CDS:2, partial [Racocetra persica]
NEDDNTINCEDTQHKNVIADNRFQLINEDPQRRESDLRYVAIILKRIMTVFRDVY